MSFAVLNNVCISKHSVDPWHFTNTIVEEQRKRSNAVTYLDRELLQISTFARARHYGAIKQTDPICCNDFILYGPENDIGWSM